MKYNAILYFSQVASWYYYKRSSLHIVETKLNYPNEALPKLESLKKNFNNCVMEGESYALLKLIQLALQKKNECLNILH